MTVVGVETVTVLRAPLVTDPRYGRKVRDWANAVAHDVSGVQVQPLAAAETDAGREYVATRMRLFGPFGADIEAADRVAYRGTTFEVDGEPAHWRDLWSVPHHCEAVLKRMAG